MEIAASRSKIRAHRKEDDGTRVHVETFVWCTHASGVTNGLEHPALPVKSKTREERRKRERKREEIEKEKGRKRGQEKKGKRKKSKERRKRKIEGKRKKRKRKEEAKKNIKLVINEMIFLKANYYMKKRFSLHFFFMFSYQIIITISINTNNRLVTCSQHRILHMLIHLDWNIDWNT